LPLEPLDAPEDAGEIHLQTTEALWQGLLVDPRA
jgi:hypothetical protein